MCIYTVSLEGMGFIGFHGCREEEKVNGNVFKVDFEARYRSDCAASDNLDDTVNYGQVYGVIAQVMRGQRRNLLETLASDIMDRVRSEFPGFISIRIKISKKNPPVAGPCEWSSITREWNND